MLDQDKRSDESSPDQLGHLAARGRVAHLLCGLSRATAAGDGGRISVELPPGTTPAARALGLTRVHFLVTVRRLGAEGLIATTGRAVSILDIERLEELAGLGPS